MRAHRFTLAAIVLAALTMPAVAQQPAYTKAGALTCRTSASVGLIVGSRQRLACIFRPDSGGPEERYVGRIGRLGLDVGITAGGVLAWAVLARTRSVPRGALAGTYVGASGDISLGVGAGANVLVGGSRRSVALQPVSVEAQVGVNLALGVARLVLQ
jgi:Protein of unknown function (DUF992)